VAVAVTPAEYAVEREFDDIAAVVSSPGEPVHLLDHSYGAFCALEAALRSQAIRSLMLYEPGIEVAGEEIYPSAPIDRLEALRAAGDRDAMVTTTMREVAGLPPQVVEQLRAQPSWQRGRRGAHHPAGAAGGEGLPVRSGSVPQPPGADAAAGRRRQRGRLPHDRSGRSRGPAHLPRRRLARAGARGDGHRHRPVTTEVHRFMKELP
jgi:hypothetical protein